MGVGWQRYASAPSLPRKIPVTPYMYGWMDHRACLDECRKFRRTPVFDPPDLPAHNERVYRLGSPGPQPLPVAGHKFNDITAARKQPSSLFSSLIKFVEAIFNAPVFQILSYYNSTTI